MKIKNTENKILFETKSFLNYFLLSLQSIFCILIVSSFHILMRKKEQINYNKIWWKLQIIFEWRFKYFVNTTWPDFYVHFNYLWYQDLFHLYISVLYSRFRFKFACDPPPAQLSTPEERVLTRFLSHSKDLFFSIFWLFSEMFPYMYFHQWILPRLFRNGRNVISSVSLPSDVCIIVKLIYVTSPLCQKFAGDPQEIKTKTRNG